MATPTDGTGRGRGVPGQEAQPQRPVARGRGLLAPLPGGLFGQGDQVPAPRVGFAFGDGLAVFGQPRQPLQGRVEHRTNDGGEGDDQGLPPIDAVIDPVTGNLRGAHAAEEPVILPRHLRDEVARLTAAQVLGQERVHPQLVQPQQPAQPAEPLLLLTEAPHRWADEVPAQPHDDSDSEDEVVAEQPRSPQATPMGSSPDLRRDQPVRPEYLEARLRYLQGQGAGAELVNDGLGDDERSSGRGSPVLGSPVGSEVDVEEDEVFSEGSGATDPFGWGLDDYEDEGRLEVGGRSPAPGHLGGVDEEDEFVAALLDGGLEHAPRGELPPLAQPLQRSTSADALSRAAGRRQEARRGSAPQMTMEEQLRQAGVRHVVSSSSEAGSTSGAEPKPVDLRSETESLTSEVDKGTKKSVGFFGSVWNGIAAVGNFIADFFTAVFHVITCHCFDKDEFSVTRKDSKKGEEVKA